VDISSRSILTRNTSHQRLGDDQSQRELDEAVAKREKLEQLEQELKGRNKDEDHHAL
jgi:hypothetical protein